MSLLARKQLIRTEQVLLRKQISAAERLKKSRDIADRLIHLKPFQEAMSVHIYLSVREEVSTQYLVEAAKNLKKQIVIPVVDALNKTLFFSEYIPGEPEKLEYGPFLTLQPKPQFLKKVDAGEIELWVVPGIAFDENGNRLGYGGGYYDRALSQNEKPVLGLAFETQLVAQLPAESTDVPVDMIVTEYRTIYCREEACDS